MVSLGNPAFLSQTCEGTPCRQKRLPTAISFSLGLPSFPFGGAGASPPAFLALGLLPQVPPSLLQCEGTPSQQTGSCFPGGCVLEGARGESKATEEEQGGVSPPFPISLLQPLPGCPSCPSARLPVPPRTLASFNLLSVKGEVFSCGPRCLPCADHLVSAGQTHGWSHPCGRPHSCSNVRASFTRVAGVLAGLCPLAGET